MTGVRGFGRIQNRQRGARDLLQFSRHDGRRVSGDDGGDLRSVHEAARSLRSLRLQLAEETLDVLDEFGEHRFTQEDVDPGVQNGVGGGKADSQQIWVSVQPLLHWCLIKLVEKHLDLKNT